MHDSPDDLYEEFRLEMAEMAQQIDDAMLRWEAVPDDPDVPDRIFRQLHTLKGSAGFLERFELAELCHAAEDVLAAYRPNPRLPAPPVLARLTEAVATIQASLEPWDPNEEPLPMARLIEQLRVIAADPAKAERGDGERAQRSDLYLEGRMAPVRAGAAASRRRPVYGGVRTGGGNGGRPVGATRRPVEERGDPLPRSDHGARGRERPVPEGTWRAEIFPAEVVPEAWPVDGSERVLMGSRLLGTAFARLEPGVFSLGPWSRERLDALAQGRSPLEVRSEAARGDWAGTPGGSSSDDPFDALLQDDRMVSDLVTALQDRQDGSDALFPEQVLEVTGGPMAVDPLVPATDGGIGDAGEATDLGDAVGPWDPAGGSARSGGEDAATAGTDAGEASETAGADVGEASATAGTDTVGIGDQAMASEASDAEARDPMPGSAAPVQEPPGSAPRRMEGARIEAERPPIVGDVSIDDGQQEPVSRAAEEERSLEADGSPASEEGGLFVERVTTVRVDVEKLDNLLNLMGDLLQEKHRQAALLETLMAEQTNDPTVTALAASHRRLDRLVGELQDGVLGTRMLPVQGVFRRYPRIVKDHAARLGKEVELVLKGEETELDRALLEGLFDPLIHLLRNAIDHGIELPHERLRRNKPRRGTITLAASHEGNQIVLEVRDDGRGIDPAEMVRRALALELIDADRAKELNDQEKIDLIFLPGFTSRTQVTETSGRGVGMSLVRDHLRRIGGLITVRSRAGEGTTLRIVMPLTLAILQVLQVRVLGARYVLPLSSVVGVHRVERERLTLYRGGWYLPRAGSMLPLFSLGVLLGLEVPHLPPEKCYLAEVGVAEKRYGVWVDGFAGIYESVIKSLDGSLTRLPGVAGGTFIGGGDMVLVLDVGTLLEGQVVPVR